jgi:OPT family oligopeptide transporter
MELMTKQDNPTGSVVLSGKQLILWSLGVAFFGVFFAVPLRRQTIIREKLKFPSGTATAQMIRLLHQQKQVPQGESTLRRRGRRYQEEEEQVERSNEEMPFEKAWSLKLRGLIASFSISSIYTLLTYFVPYINAIPVFNWITFNLIDMRAWEWYFTPSLSYVGQGIIMGLPTTLSMLAGCIVGWGVLSPLAYYMGWAPGPVDDWKTGSKGWILWISLGVMIAESCVSLAIVLVRTVIRVATKEEEVDETTALLDEYEKEEVDAPKSQQVSNWTALVGLGLSTLACICLVRMVFGPDVLPQSMTLLAVIVAMFLSILGVRALGETDLNPVSGIGKISQVFFAMTMPGNVLANLIAGGIAEAGAQQAGKEMRDCVI